MSVAQHTPEQLYASALDLVEQGQAAAALKVAKQLWAQVQSGGTGEKLAAVNLLGEISIELGAVESAREYFERAVQLDPDGRVPEALGGGAEKFLWLAQLNDEGGRQSVRWFEKGAEALRHEIAALDAGRVPGVRAEDVLALRAEKQRKLATALCGIVEVYMTDLSWEEDAEARCENLITQAVAVEDEAGPEVLQTLASVRLSQQRHEDARSALKRSLALWMHLEPEHAAVPEFASRVSLARLLMEARLEKDAMEVLHRLVQEDDQSVEAWYLGGWCQHLMAESNKVIADAEHRPAGVVGAGDASPANQARFQRAISGSRKWLKTALKLYAQLEYEDERLFEHATELVRSLDMVLGSDEEQAEGADDDDDDDEWEGMEEGDEEDEEEEEGGGDDDDDEEMADS